mmetsp:Transcript_37770/g.77579  ORF Transcript_37770/g.77579 Transcript_37770/m.77579 type:complete len:483 (-) Transcript_37770:110-1558(-)
MTSTNENMNPVHTFEGHSGRVFSLAVCSLPDGRRFVASASHDRTVRIWCANTLQHLRTIQYSDFVWRVFIIKDPKPCVVAYISTEEKIVVSDLMTGETENIFNGRIVFAGNIPSMFPQPVALTVEGEENIAFIDVMTGQTLKTLVGGFGRMFRAVITRGAEPALVFTTWNSQNRRSTIQYYELIDHPDMAPPPPPPKPERKEGEEQGEHISESILSSLKMSSRNDDVFDEHLNIIRVEDKSCEGEKEDEGGEDEESGNDIVGNANDGIVDMPMGALALAQSKTTLMFEGDSRDGVTSLVVTNTTTQRICSAHYDFKVRIWSLETKDLLMTLEGHNDYVGVVAVWKGPQPIILTGCSDGEIKAWNTQDGECIATGASHTRDAWALGITHGPKPIIISGSFDRTLKVWDLNPILAGVRWERRKGFLIFLYAMKFALLHDPRTDDAATKVTSVNTATSSILPPHQCNMEWVLGNPAFHRLITYYL